MSVPAPQPPRNDGRWETIRYALEDWGRTLRFCVIWLVVIVAPAVAGYAAAHPLAELIRPLLLCGPGGEGSRSVRRLRRAEGGGAGGPPDELRELSLRRQIEAPGPDGGERRGSGVTHSVTGRRARAGPSEGERAAHNYAGCDV